MCNIQLENGLKMFNMINCLRLRTLIAIFKYVVVIFRRIIVQHDYITLNNTEFVFFSCGDDMSHLTLKIVIGGIRDANIL